MTKPICNDCQLEVNDNNNFLIVIKGCCTEHDEHRRLCHKCYKRYHWLKG